MESSISKASEESFEERRAEIKEMVLERAGKDITDEEADKILYSLDLLVKAFLGLAEEQVKRDTEAAKDKAESENQAHLI